MQKEGISLFSAGTFFSHSGEIIRGRNYSMFQQKPGMGNFYAEERDITIF